MEALGLAVLAGARLEELEKVDEDGLPKRSADERKQGGREGRGEEEKRLEEEGSPFGDRRGGKARLLRLIHYDV